MGDFWVFGYGSLMWRPGFDFIESEAADLAGAHRSLCVYSWVHRGTRQKPGLVLGLDQGGSCRGVAFRVRAGERDAVLAYLRARELVTNVYREVTRPIRLRREGRPRVGAVTYMVDRAHRQYAGRLGPEAILAHVRAGRGRSGANSDYIVNTVAHLRALGLADPVLERIVAALADTGTRGD